MLANIFTLIIDTIAVVLGGALLLRFWMQVTRVRPPNSLGQFIFQLTDWLVRPLRRMLPGVGGYDWASLVGAILVALLATALELALMIGFEPQAMAVLALGRILRWAIYGLIGLLLIEVIFSWVNPHAPLAPFVRAMNEPLLRPLRRVVPSIGSIDLSPLVALILLQIALQLVSAMTVQLL